MRFQGKVAIVTGGSRGIGQAIAHALAMEGATVALIARNMETGSEAAAQIEADGGKAFFLQADVSDKEQVCALSARRSSAWGELTSWSTTRGFIRRRLLNKRPAPTGNRFLR